MSFTFLNCVGLARVSCNSNVIYIFLDNKPRGSTGNKPSVRTVTTPKVPETKRPTPPPAKPENINHSMNNYTYSGTPYPNNGIILQSLNYIQMDVLSSLFVQAETNDREVQSSINNKNYRREHALLSEALHNIENNFRSLFWKCGSTNIMLVDLQTNFCIMVNL